MMDSRDPMVLSHMLPKGKDRAVSQFRDVTSKAVRGGISLAEAAPERFLRYQSTRINNFRASELEARVLMAYGHLEEGHYERLWEALGRRLVDFQGTHGEMPYCRDARDLDLGRTVANLVRTYDLNLVFPARQAALEALGFSWLRQELIWEERFSEVLALAEDEQDPPANSGPLGLWLHKQRQRIRNQEGRSRKERFEAAGIRTTPAGESAWDRQFAKLLEFYKANNHTRVPTLNKDDPQFGRWVSTQRRQYLDGTLSKDRIRRLSALGFEWSIYYRDTDDLEIAA